MQPRADELLRLLELQPHPEGGHYREVFRSGLTVQPDRMDAPRSALTSIHFLLRAGERSRWHRVLSDEAWHFHEGDPLELFWLDPSGTRCHRERLGPAAEGQRPLHVVPAGCWQAARPAGAYALVGCDVGPGFDFADFSLLDAHPAVAELIRRDFPDLADLI